jgi:hypothetical protein
MARARQERGLTRAGLEYPWGPITGWISWPESDLRPEEDAGFLPRRDGTAQPRCYGAARRAWRNGAERNDMLELRGLTRRYGDLVALDDLSLTVAEGQMFGVCRPQRRGQDHRHADHPQGAGARRPRGPLARTTNE